MKFVTRPHVQPISKAVKPLRRSSPTSGDYRAIHRVADRLRPVVQASLTKGILSFRKKLDLRKILNALEEGRLSDIDRTVFETDIADALKELENVLEKGIRLSGEESTKFFKRAIRSAIPTVDIAPFAFTTDNLRVRNFIRRETGKLIQGVTAETQKAIQNVVITAFNEGLPPGEAAKLIERSVGLTTKQAQSVNNFRKKLVADGVRGRRLDRLVDRFSDRQIRIRTKNIARTETIRATNFGQMAVWDQAADAGLFDRATSKKQWVVTRDQDLDCAICAPLSRVKVELDGQFTNPVTGESIDAPPAHPQCRCAITIIFGELEES